MFLTVQTKLQQTHFKVIVIVTTFLIVTLLGVSQILAVPKTNFTIIDNNALGYKSSMVFTSNGIPVISYIDDNNSNLKLAVCNNLACTEPTITTVDQGGTQ